MKLGGTGDAKIGGNYAPGIRPQIEVAKEGFAQILWLFGKDYNVTEGLNKLPSSFQNFNLFANQFIVGTMNFFMYWKNEKGETELLTPPLDGTILPGVTRDSIITLAREWGISVAEKPVKMSEIIAAYRESRIIEMFGAGTAAIVSPIKRIKFDEHDLNIPLDSTDPDAQAGPLTKKIAETIMGIQYGEIPHKWSVLVDQLYSVF